MMKMRLGLLCFLMGLACFGQESRRILEIRKNFKKWQPILRKEMKRATKLFRYCGKCDYTTEQRSGNSEVVYILKKKTLGTFVKIEGGGESAFVNHYYFDSLGRLYFVFVQHNSIHMGGEERIYFDTYGNCIRRLEKNYSPNEDPTKIPNESRPKKYDDVTKLKEMGFYDLWRSIE